MSLRTKVTWKCMYWLSRIVTRFYARLYIPMLKSRGLDWTMELVDEDIERFGNPYLHTLVKAELLRRHHEGTELNR